MPHGSMARYGGVYIGRISNTANGNHQGQVQVQVPSLAMTSVWAPVCTPFGASRTGGPQIDNKVLVAFEGGDPDRPIVLGMLPDK